MSEDTIKVKKSFLRADSELKKERILDILGEELCCSFPLDIESYENDDDSVYPAEFDDRVYIDGNVSFDKMAEIVDYLRATNSKTTMIECDNTNRIPITVDLLKNIGFVVSEYPKYDDDDEIDYNCQINFSQDDYEISIEYRTLYRLLEVSKARKIHTARPEEFAHVCTVCNYVDELQICLKYLKIEKEIIYKY